jgi:hypothetical protein
MANVGARDGDISLALSFIHQPLVPSHEPLVSRGAQLLRVSVEVVDSQFLPTPDPRPPNRAVLFACLTP